MKALYALIFTICLVVFLVQSVGFFEKYLNKDTSVSLEITDTSRAIFPSLTICPDYDVAYKRKELEKYGTNVKNIRNLIFPNLNKFNLTTRDFFKMVTYNLTEIVSKVDISTLQTFNGSNATKLSIYDPILYEDSDPPRSESVVHVPLDDQHWKEYAYDNFGMCYNYKIPLEHRKLGILDVAFLVKLNALVYIHHDEQFYGPDTDTKVPGEIGKLIFLDVEHGVTIAYPKELKETKNGRKKFSCERKMSTEYDDCVAQVMILNC